MAARLFAGWAEALKAPASTRSADASIGDDNAFDDEALGPGWAWDDLPGRDATGISGLQFNENVAQATVAPGIAIGEPAIVSLLPAGSHLEIDNRLTTVADGTAP